MIDLVVITRVATEALVSFLGVTECVLMVQQLEEQNVCSMFHKEDTCPHGMLSLARLLAAERFEEVFNCVEELCPSLTSIYDAHRLTVVAFYSEVRRGGSGWN